MENFNKRIYDLHMEVIDAILNLVRKSGKETIEMEDVFNMCYDADCFDATLVKCVYDGLTLTIYDNKGCEYGISNFSSLEGLVVFYETLVWYLEDNENK